MDELQQKEFLERTPPGTKVHVTDFEATDRQGIPHMRMPEIELHCAQCNGQRFFAPQVSGAYVRERQPVDAYLDYYCRNCRRALKTFAVGARYDEGAKKWTVFKYGEEPSFGSPTPARAISLMGPDRDQFLKGRRCENQGLGVGAFVYYRRVVENQKNRIFDEIIRVSQHLGADEQLIADLEAAKKETQFTKAVDTIKHALPQSLLVNGHNPLSLLHSALSEGVHGLTDAQCLDLASSVRIVLIELADRLSQAMKDEAELNEAVNKLARKKG
jgi:hypothetical protein